MKKIICKDNLQMTKFLSLVIGIVVNLSQTSQKFPLQFLSVVVWPWKMDTTITDVSKPKSPCLHTAER